MKNKTANKRQCFTIVTGKQGEERDIEFIDPNAHREELKARGENVNLADTYQSMQLIYRDPGEVMQWHTDKEFDEKRVDDDSHGYHESVFKYASINGRIDVPISKKKDAQYILRLCQRLNPNAYLDTVTALSFDEVPDNPDDDKVIPLKGLPKPAPKK